MADAATGSNPRTRKVSKTVTKENYGTDPNNKVTDSVTTTGNVQVLNTKKTATNPAAAERLARKLEDQTGKYEPNRIVVEPKKRQGYKRP